MGSLRLITHVVHLAVGTLLLAVGLRAWLVMGLIEPVTVAGSSMAPALRGPFNEIQCARCNHQFDIGAEFPAERVACLRCGYAGNTAEGLLVHRGDRLLVDRTAFEFRLPQRWETVVFHAPEDGQLTVKRVVGLPGETVHLSAGDVWVDGQIARKPLDAMRAMRQLVHEESRHARRWQPTVGSGWQWHTGAWHFARNSLPGQWLVYQHPGGEAITNDMAYNARSTRQLFPVHDFALSTEVHAAASGDLVVEIGPLAARFAYPIEQGESVFELFAFDDHVQAYVDGTLTAGRPLEPAVAITGIATPFALQVKSGTTQLRNLRLYHDIYYSSLAEQAGDPRPGPPITLADDELFVLGDNAAVSVDSRQWGPVPGRLVVGKPLTIR